MCWAGMGWYGYVEENTEWVWVEITQALQFPNLFNIWMVTALSSREFKVPSNPCGSRLATCSSCDCFRRKLTILDLPPFFNHVVTLWLYCTMQFVLFSPIFIYLSTSSENLFRPRICPSQDWQIPRNEKQLELQKLLQQAKSSGDLTDVRIIFWGLNLATGIDIDELGKKHWRYLSWMWHIWTGILGWVENHDQIKRKWELAEIWRIFR